MKTRWNPIDWGLLVLALCLLAGGVFLGWKKPWARENRETVICILRSAPVDRRLHDPAALTAPGDAVFAPAGGAAIGEVLAVSVSPEQVLTRTDDGLRFTDDPERDILEVTVRLSLENRTVGTKRLAAGGTVDLIFGSFLAAGCEIVTLGGDGNAEP